MSEPKPQHNQNCHNEHHDEHLCYLMYMGVHLENNPAYKKLVENPQYRCKRCSRSTGSPLNLCEPTPLKK